MYCKDGGSVAERLERWTRSSSLYSGHWRDLEVVSSLARVRYSGSLFQSNVCNLFSLGNLPLSVLLRCPWWRSVRKARVDCTQRARVQVHPWPLAGFVLDSPAFKSSSALVNSQLVCLRPVGILNPLTNRPQFPMVYTLINQRNGVIKCSKLMWNHEPLVSMQSFKHFMVSFL